jgi:octaprenyl-diphosphate synthase
MDTGKLAGADLKERKITLPLLCAMEAAPHKEGEIRQLLQKIENNIAANGEITASEKDVIGQITSFVNEQNGIEKAQAVLEEQISKAIEAIAILPESTAKERLVQLAEYVGKRNN